jgi:hypothetical protein
VLAIAPPILLAKVTFLGTTRALVSSSSPLMPSAISPLESASPLVRPAPVATIAAITRTPPCATAANRPPMLHLLPINYFWLILHLYPTDRERRGRDGARFGSVPSASASFRSLYRIAKRSAYGTKKNLPSCWWSETYALQKPAHFVSRDFNGT